MRTPEFYYRDSLAAALRGNINEAKSLKEIGDARRQDLGMSFAEASSDQYPFIEEALETLLDSFEFTRCVRPNGTAYGTGGTCRKGTEQKKTTGDRRLEREIPLANTPFNTLNVPVNKPERSPEQIQKDIERNKKQNDSMKKREEEKKALEEVKTDMAKKVLKITGYKTDTPEKEKNMLDNVKDTLSEIYLTGLGGGTELVKKGDLKGLINYAREARSKGEKEHIAPLIKAERESQKTLLKRRLEELQVEQPGASIKELKESKSMANLKYDVDKDLKRVKALGQRQYQYLSAFIRYFSDEPRG
jgi:hypothetical protein